MVRQIAQDVFGEILETGRSTARQAKQTSPAKIASKAMEQVTGQLSSDDIPGLEDLKAKKMPPAKLWQKKQQDAVKSSQDISSTRLALKRLIVQRYQQMQDKIKQSREKKEQVVLEEQREEIEEVKIKEKEARERGKIVLPKGPKSKGFLGIFSKQKKGTKELSKGVIG